MGHTADPHKKVPYPHTGILENPLCLQWYLLTKPKRNNGSFPAHSRLRFICIINWPQGRIAFSSNHFNFNISTFSLNREWIVLSCHQKAGFFFIAFLYHSFCHYFYKKKSPFGSSALALSWVMVHGQVDVWYTNSGNFPSTRNHLLMSGTSTG